MSEQFESIMTAQEKAAQNYAVGTCLDFENNTAGTVNVLLEIEKAFKAGAEWHKQQALKEIIKDVESRGETVIVVQNADLVPAWFGMIPASTE